jgi:putative serine protease PepD
MGAFALATRDDNPAPARHDALPAVADKPLAPKKGQTRAGAVYDKASPAVLSVRAGNGSGTAFLVDGDGTIVTNAHVVAQNRQVTVRFGRDHNAVQAQVLGSDTSIDLAVLKIDPNSIPAGVQPLKFADSRNVRVGDMAIAIGNPFGLDRTATEGIVSAVDRDIQAPNGFSIDSVIQTDAPINPGNSGGPLLDDAGNVIGVNSQIATAGAGGNVGIGFAVPSNTVRAAIPALKRGETIRRAYMGVETSPTATGQLDGAEVQNIVPDGPADRAGLQVGDIIRSVDGRRIADPAALSAAISQRTVGDVAKVEIERAGAAQTIEVPLGSRPAKAG